MGAPLNRSIPHRRCEDLMRLQILHREWTARPKPPFDDDPDAVSAALDVAAMRSDVVKLLSRGPETAG